MAYDFSKTQALVDGEKKQNIFGAEGQAAQDTTQDLSGPTGAADVKTSTEGSVGSDNGPSSGGSSQSTAKVSAPTTDSSAKANQAAIQANAGRTKSPKAISGIQDALTAASNNLQAQADQYGAQGRAATNYGISGDDLRGAYSGNQEAFGKVNQLFNTKAPEKVKEFEAPKVDVSDVNLLKNDAGLRQILSRGRGPNYSAGEAAFDVGSLRRNKDFQNTIQSFGQQQADLNKRAVTTKEAAEKGLADYRATELQRAQEAARGGLTAAQQKILDQNAAEAEAFNKSIDNANINPYAFFGNAVNDAYSGAVTGVQDARLRAAIQEQNPNSYSRNLRPSDYISYADKQNADAFMSPEEAAQFNQIHALLGDNRTAAGVNAPTSPYKIDQDALRAAITQRGADRLAQQDSVTQSEIDKLLAGARNQANIKNASASAAKRDQSFKEADAAARAAGLFKRKPEEIQATNNADILNQVMNPNVDPRFNSVEDLGVDPEAYYSIPTYDQQDFYDPNTLAQLNALTKKLGKESTYKEGSPSQKKATFNKDAYLAAVRALRGL